MIHDLTGERIIADGVMPDQWSTGSVVVMLDGLPEQISLLRNTLRVAQTYRIGPAKRAVSDPSYTERVEAFAGIGLRPYSPVHLKAGTNQDGALDSDDFFDFLVAFFDGSSEADVNGDNAVDSDDFFDFFNNFLAGC